MSDDKLFRPSLPLALTLGGMICIGILTTALGFLLWPDPKPHHDTSTEGMMMMRSAPPPSPAPAPAPAKPDSAAAPTPGQP